MLSSANVEHWHTAAGGCLNPRSSWLGGTRPLRIGKHVQFALQVIYLMLKGVILGGSFIDLLVRLDLVPFEFGFNLDRSGLLYSYLFIALFSSSNCLLCFLYCLSIRCLELLGDPFPFFVKFQVVQFVCFCLRFTYPVVIGCLVCC